MRLIRCQAINFMGFSELELELDHPMVVLLADNGVGKSSALKAMRVALGGWMLGVPGVDSVSIKQWMKRHELRRVGYELTKETVGTTTVAAVARLGPASEIIYWRRSCEPSERARTNRKDAYQVREAAKGQLEAEAALPLFAYYGARRGVPKSITPKRSGPQPRSMGYDRALESSIDYNERFGRWLRLHLQAQSNEDARSVYEALLEALARLLPGVSRVEFHPDFEEPVVTFEGHTAGGGLRAFSALSDGFQNILGLGLDIALRAIQLNPQLNGAVLRETTGVVLIDEADQHLHPTWQAQIPAGLRAAFPKLQFILATHSPLVAMGAAPMAKIIRLRGGEPIELSAKNLGATVGDTLRSEAFDLATTWAPAVLDLVRTRGELLNQLGVGIQDDALEAKLRENAKALAAHRGGGPITHTEDLVRVLLNDIANGVIPLTPQRAAQLREQFAQRLQPTEGAR